MQNLPILYGAHRPDLCQHETLADLFEDTAQRHPNQTALVYNDGIPMALTYAQLDAKANNTASFLLKHGVQSGCIVGLWLPRGLDLLVMQLAIAKTGAAWLPFDADTPLERIQVCLLDAKAIGLLTCHTWQAECIAHFLPNFPSCVVWAAEETVMLSSTATHQIRTGTSPQDPAYVIYTSGSTGKPKGIVVNQASICHFLRSENAVLQIQPTDLVYQGFSVAFDMSFEEIWLSYLVGATLWIAPKSITSDPEALPLAMAKHGITVLHAVPTLLALFSQDVPSLRLINLGGEACPESLVSRFYSDNRLMFNTYGPTEATVSASLAALQPNVVVTIGKPLPNYNLMVIATDPQRNANGEFDLKLLPFGEVGELCIGGPGVAVGYLGRDDLTAEKFLPNPWAEMTTNTNSVRSDATSQTMPERLYRTGDLAAIQNDGTVHCLGRADDQIKIRGFRVELGEIENILVQQTEVANVAVVLRKDDDMEQIVAFIVPNSQQPNTPFEVVYLGQHLRKILALILPPYMVPSHFEFMLVMPRLLSGKIDRNALKKVALQNTTKPDGEADTPENFADEILFSALQKLFPSQNITRKLDFFSDLGGHSLMAARLVSLLRQHACFTYFKIADVYQQRNIGKIARILDEAHQKHILNEPVNSNTNWANPPAWKRWLCGLVQAICIPPLVAMRMAQWLAPFFAYHFLTGDPNDSITMAILLSVGVFLLLTIVEFAIAIVGKWLVAGRFQAGSYPLWGTVYFRWWLCDRLIEAAPVYMLSGSSLYPMWLRALGAKIGDDVVVGSISLRVPDLFEVGDCVSIGNAVNFENARVQHGRLLLGNIQLAASTCVGSYCVLEGGTALQRSAHLEGQSALSEGQTVPAERIWQGSPAKDIGKFDDNSQPPRPHLRKSRAFGETVFFAIGSLFVTALFFMPVFPSFLTIDWLDDEGLFTEWLPFQTNSIPLQLIKYFVLAFPATTILVMLTMLLSAAIRWGILPKLKAGQYAVHSNTYCRKWFVNQIQESSLNALHGLYATVYSPFWYRMLGATVGKGAEISTALGVVPDMLTLGDETFIADAVLLGDEQIDGGWMTLQPTTIAKRSFIGNGAYIPDGTFLPENVLIGVHSTAPHHNQATMRNGDTWLGSPPMHLPAREETKGFPESLTFNPSWIRRLGRSAVEAFRIVSPHALTTAVGYTIVLDVMPAAGKGRWLEVFVDLLLSGLLYGIGSFVLVLIAKWTLIFKYKKSSTPMWTPFVWLSEGITNLYEGIAIPNFLRYLKGTPWLPVAFRLLGCKIGKGVYMDTTDITEFDCVQIGNHSELNAMTCPQTHLFEDRIMKIDHVCIGERVNMGARSSVLYSATVGNGVNLGPLTLVMKSEFIPPNTNWSGCPAAMEY